jgi:integrase
MGRRGNGEGLIRQRADGLWEGRLTLPTGKHKSFYGKRRQDIQRKLDDARRDLAQGILPQNSRLTLDQYLAVWLETCRPPQLAPSTYLGYERYVRKDINPALGATPLALLTAQMLQRFYADKLAEGLAPTTVRHIHACLRKALQDGVRQGLFPRNMADLAKAPPMRAKVMRTWSQEEANHFLDAAHGDRLEALWALALTTGMREGELLGLRWRDVDVEGREVHIQRALARGLERNRELAAPKTTASRRHIRLTEYAVNALRRHRARQAEERLALGAAWASGGEGDLVFTNTVGNALDPTNLTRSAFKPLIERAQVPTIRIHDLRHTAATLLLKQGIGIKVVTEMLGHSDVAITLRIYAHVLPDMQAQAAAALDALFGGANEALQGAATSQKW